MNILVTAFKSLCLAPLDLLSAYWPFGKKDRLSDADKEFARKAPYHSGTDNLAQVPWAGPERPVATGEGPNVADMATDIGSGISGGGGGE